MSKELMDALYIEHNDKLGVLSNNKEERVSIILGTDKTLVERKQEGKTYLLVPLTKNHSFAFDGDCIEVDGVRFNSEMYFREDGAQWIELDKETLSKVA